MPRTSAAPNSRKRDVTSLGSWRAGGNAGSAMLERRVRWTQPGPAMRHRPQTPKHQHCCDIDPTDEALPGGQNQPPGAQQFHRDQRKPVAPSTRREQRSRGDISAKNGSRKWPNATIPAMSPQRAGDAQCTRRLMRQVGLPDDKQLHEVEIDPQHQQGLQQPAEVAQRVRATAASRRRAARDRERKQSRLGGGHHAVGAGD